MTVVSKDETVAHIRQAVFNRTAEPITLFECKNKKVFLSLKNERSWSLIVARGMVVNEYTVPLRARPDYIYEKAMALAYSCSDGVIRYNTTVSKIFLVGKSSEDIINLMFKKMGIDRKKMKNVSIDYDECGERIRIKLTADATAYIY